VSLLVANLHAVVILEDAQIVGRQILDPRVKDAVRSNGVESLDSRRLVSLSHVRSMIDSSMMN